MWVMTTGRLGDENVVWWRFRGGRGRRWGERGDGGALESAATGPVVGDGDGGRGVLGR
jgi:hypothetical protein